MTITRGSRIVVMRLNADELSFIAQVMNTAADGDWAAVNKQAQRHLAKSSRFVIWSREQWSGKTPYGQAKTQIYGAQGWSEYHLRNRWKDARNVFSRILVEQRESPGFFCPVPFLALPEKKPRFVINNPEGLALWLTARMAANRQWHAIVKCERCRKFAVHARARRGMKYCMDCKGEANRDRAIIRYQERQKYPAQQVRRYAQLKGLEKKTGKLSAPLMLEKWKLEAKPRRLVDVARDRALHEVLDVPEIPEHCPTCSKPDDRQPLTFAEKLQHTSGTYENVWYCRRCSQVVRKPA